MNDPVSNPHQQPHQPIFNVPKIILVLIASFVAIHLYRTYAISRDEDINLLLQFAFIPQRYTESELNLFWPWAVYWSPLTYSFLHGDWAHLIVNCLWLLVFGAVVAKRLTIMQFFLLCALGSIAAAALHYVFNAGALQIMIGASGVVSACTGAACRFAFTGGSFNSSNTNPIQSLEEVFRNKRAITFILVWFGINIVFGAGVIPIAGEGQPIAWIAHIGGFLCGLLILPYLADRG